MSQNFALRRKQVILAYLVLLLWTHKLKTGWKIRETNSKGQAMYSFVCDSLISVKAYLPEIWTLLYFYCAVFFSKIIIYTYV